MAVREPTELAPTVLPPGRPGPTDQAPTGAAAAIAPLLAVFFPDGLPSAAQKLWTRRKGAKEGGMA